MATYSKQTQDAVITLLKQGHAPSWRKVREITGSGSSNDILREVKAVLSDLADRGKAGDHPQEAQEAFWSLWNSAKHTALNEFSAERQALQSTTEAAQRAATEAVESLQVSTATLQTKDEEIASLQELIKQASAREQGLNEQITAAAQRTDAERARSEGMTLEIQRLSSVIQAQMEAAKTDLAAEIARRNEIVAQMATQMQEATNRFNLEIKNEAARYNNDTAAIMRKWDAERTQSRQETKELRAEIKALQGASHKQQEKAYTAEKELAAASARIEALLQRIVKAEEANEKLTQDVKEGQSELISAKFTNALLKSQLKDIPPAD